MFLSNNFASPIESTSTSVDCLFKKYLTNIPLIYSRMMFTTLIPIIYLIIAFIYYLIMILIYYYT